MVNRVAMANGDLKHALMANAQKPDVLRGNPLVMANAGLKAVPASDHRKVIVAQMAIVVPRDNPLAMVIVAPRVVRVNDRRKVIVVRMVIVALQVKAVVARCLGSLNCLTRITMGRSAATNSNDFPKFLTNWIATKTGSWMARNCLAHLRDRPMVADRAMAIVGPMAIGRAKVIVVPMDHHAAENADQTASALAKGIVREMASDVLKGIGLVMASVAPRPIGRAMVNVGQSHVQKVVHLVAKRKTTNPVTRPSSERTEQETQN